MVMFAVAPYAGPSLGPVVAGWISTSGADWRWIFWVLTIFVSAIELPYSPRLTSMQAGVCTITVVFTIPETYRCVCTLAYSEIICNVSSRPVLLVAKARKLRMSTGDDRYYAPMEANKLPLGHRLEAIFLKPFKLFLLEPMMASTTLYMSVRSSYPRICQFA